MAVVVVVLVYNFSKSSQFRYLAAKAREGGLSREEN